MGAQRPRGRRTRAVGDPQRRDRRPARRTARRTGGSGAARLAGAGGKRRPEDDEGRRRGHRRHPPGRLRCRGRSMRGCSGSIRGDRRHRGVLRRSPESGCDVYRYERMAMFRPRSTNRDTGRHWAWLHSSWDCSPPLLVSRRSPSAWIAFSAAWMISVAGGDGLKSRPAGFGRAQNLATLGLWTT